MGVSISRFRESFFFSNYKHQQTTTFRGRRFARTAGLGAYGAGLRFHAAGLGHGHSNYEPFLLTLFVDECLFSSYQ